MNKEDIAVRIFPSAVSNYAQLVFKTSFKNLARQETLKLKNFQLSFFQCNALMMKCKVPQSCSAAGASSASSGGFEHPGTDDVCLSKWTI